MTKAEPTKRAKPKSKKHIISSLPATWRDDLFAWKCEEVNSRKREGQSIADVAGVLLPMAISRITGCRPDEIETGITVRNFGNGLMSFQISGSKVLVDDDGEKTRGIEKRGIVVNIADTQEAQWLVAWLGERKSGKATYKAKTFVDTMARVIDSYCDKGNKKFSAYDARQKTAMRKVSPYAYRHAMAFDMLSCPDMARAEMSAVLGQMSTKSIESYGRKRKSRTAKRPVVKVGIGETDQVIGGDGIVMMNHAGLTEAGRQPQTNPRLTALIESKTPRAAAPARGVRGASPKR